MKLMFVTNEKGKKVGVLVPLKEYEKMMKALEDAADERSYQRAMRRKEKTISLREAIKIRKAKLKEKNSEV